MSSSFAQALKVPNKDELLHLSPERLLDLLQDRELRETLEESFWEEKRRIDFADFPLVLGCSHRKAYLFLVYQRQRVPAVKPVIEVVVFWLALLAAVILAPINLLLLLVAFARRVKERGSLALII